MSAAGPPVGPPDAVAFEAFVREYQDMVYAVALRLLARPADAEDVAQTVFLPAYERFASLRDHPTVAGWLKTVATNQGLKHLARYRSRWRLFSEMGSSGDDRHPFDARAAADDPTAALDQAQRQARLEQALARLPDAQRVPLVLFHFEQHSYDEIASLLALPVGTVKTHIHRGRLTLRTWLS